MGIQRVKLQWLEVGELSIGNCTEGSDGRYPAVTEYQWSQDIRGCVI